MAHYPTPILVVSSANRGELFRTYDALAAGAVDVLEKPRGDDSDADWGARLCAAVTAGVADPGDHAPARPGSTRRERAGAGAPPGRAVSHAGAGQAGRDRRLDRRAGRARTDLLRALPAGFRCRCCACSTSAASRSRWRSPTGSTSRPGTRAATRGDGDAGQAARRAGRAGAARPPPAGARRAAAARATARRGTRAGRRSTCCSSRSPRERRGRGRRACSPAWAATAPRGCCAMRRARRGSPSRRTRRAAWCTACRARPCCSDAAERDAATGRDRGPARRAARPRGRADERHGADRRRQPDRADGPAEAFEARGFAHRAVRHRRRGPRRVRQADVRRRACCDVLLPDGDGVELLRELRAHARPRRRGDRAAVQRGRGQRSAARPADRRRRVRRQAVRRRLRGRPGRASCCGEAPAAADAPRSRCWSSTTA